jgi:N-acetylglucosamine transport system substrate-binding protein
MKLKDVTIDGLYVGAQRYNKVSYNLPDSGWTGGLFYDKALFEKNGWNQDPKTWDEFLALLDTIKAAGVIPITYPGVYSAYLDFGFGPKDFEIAEGNGNLDAFYTNYKNIGTPWYTAPETKEKWNRIYEMGKKGYFPDGVAAINHTQSQMQVMQHKAAMVVTGSWVQNEMKDATPEGFVWGFMGVPAQSADQTIWLRNGVQGGINIWAGKPELNKKWGKEFALWLMNLDVQKAAVALSGSIPVRKDFGDDPARLDALQDAPKAVSAYTSQHKVRFENQMQDVTLTDPTWAQSGKILADEIPAITNGKKDPGPILEAAEKLLETALANQKK